MLTINTSPFFSNFIDLCGPISRHTITSKYIKQTNPKQYELNSDTQSIPVV